MFTESQRALRYGETRSSYLTAGVIAVHSNPLTRSRVGRIAWSLFRHPVKSREFPAKHERLVTAADVLRYSG